MSEPQPHPSGELDGEDEEAPRVEPAGLVDELFAVNIRETRERLKLSQGELARRMAERGFPYYQQTIRRIEEGRRKVSVGEAKAIAQILRTTMDRLTWPGQEASAAALLDERIAAASYSYHEIIVWTSNLLFAQRRLAVTVEEIERAAFREKEKFREILAKAHEVLRLAPDAAIQEGARQESPADEETGDERS